MSKQRIQTTGMDFGIRVALVVEREGHLLLVRHRKPEAEPYWVLPGGRLEPGESIPECATRELHEETGLSGNFLGVLYVSEFMTTDRHTVDITLRASAEGEASLGEDPEVGEDEEPTLREVRWLEASRLEEVDLKPPWVKRRLIEDRASRWPAQQTYLRSDHPDER